MAEQLWRLLGFARTGPADLAFTEADVEALRLTRELIELGILGPDSQAALVRTWGRSYARLAEWQTSLLADIAVADADPERRLAELAESVLPRVEALQSYVWRRHLASATGRALAVESAATPVSPLAVCFVDIVGYTSRSKALDQAELVGWLEQFEDAATGVVVDHGGRIIKTIGDEVLFVADRPVDAAEAALRLTARGADEADPFPAVRAGIAYGDVVSRLGDVFGPTVNVAARLTSVARPGTVLVDDGCYAALSGRTGDGDPTGDPTGETAGDAAAAAAIAATGGTAAGAAVADTAGEEAGEEAGGEDAGTPYAFRRMRRVSVKGYSRLQPWVLRRAE
ncbi:adenylate/guanylate cyclase domain-containing protein [Nocardioides sp.]|uniref:adenylate/guanylate cyclase domain-containing protein n=1 Tax=Nocardioides sp. TaxID=35761 RepID=UPI00261B5470|nr:adenylate/guanylate cyclase domain-containing protein [Nocardioides sp.]MDI6911423.1 adenylate/guanylate cyclase domain-containing protein [Nocardioides sp.]